ncbi:GNAT family N-acetyltransferase [Thermodesulfatator atlanticus]
MNDKKKEKITIKQLKDIKPLASELKRIYLEAYQDDYLYAYREPQRVKRYLKWLIKHADGGFWVAFVNDKPVGFIAIQPDCRFHGEIVPEIHELVVDPAYQGRGIGKLLIQKALDFLSEKGFDRVALWVGERNEDAKRFYEKLGFRVTDRQGAWLRMEKELQTSSEKRSSSLSRTAKASTTSESSMISSGV